LTCVILQQSSSLLIITFTTASPAFRWTAIFWRWDDLLPSWRIFNRLVLDITNIKQTVPVIGEILARDVSQLCQCDI
jgi:hypothetical protein